MRSIRILFRVLTTLLFGFSSTYQIHAQALPDGESSLVGYRRLPNRAVSLFGQRSPGIVDTTEVYGLNEQFYVQFDKSLSAKDERGARYVKCYIPGYSDPKSQERATGSSGSNLITKNDLGRGFFIRESDLPEEINPSSNPSAKSKEWEREQRFSRFSIGVMSVPFKLRFSSPGRFQATSESALGPSIALTLFRDRNFDSKIALVGSFGGTFINPNTYFDNQDSLKQKNIPGLSFSGGIIGSVQKTQFGIVAGADFADGDWVFNGKPWIALSVGYAFYTLKGGDAQTK